MQNNDNAKTRQPRRLLIAGAMAGLLAAAASLLQTPPVSDNSAVAVVNDQLIRKEDYLSYVALLARDKRNPLNQADYRHLLRRMIEEQLLIERGIELGLHHSDASVKKAITASMIQQATAASSGAEASDEQLQTFYQEHQRYFARPPRVQLRHLAFRDADREQARRRAEDARRALLEGADFAEVEQQFASPASIPLPGSPLPANKLRQYLGPQLTEQALQLDSGEISAVLASDKGFSLLLMLDHQRTSAPPLDQIRDQVANEYRRRAGDRALQQYLQRLFDRADIRIDEAFIEELIATTEPQP